MATSVEFIGASPPSSRPHTTFNDRHAHRLAEAKTNLALMHDLLSGEKYSINICIEKYKLNRNIITLRLITLAAVAAAVSSLHLDAKKNTHSVFIDLATGGYDFKEVEKFYEISRNEMIICLADVAKEGVEKGKAMGWSKEKLVRVMTWHDRGKGLGLVQSIARVEKEDAEEVKKELREEEWVDVEMEDAERM